jgi:endonuclease/exonuclease/phosphatase family metal-dependent hydrolase
MFIRRGAFDILDDGEFWLSPTPDAPGSRHWGSVTPRMVSWVRLRTAAGGEVFWFNTHMEPHWGFLRLKGIRLLRRRMAEIAAEGPVLVTGDFNALPVWREHRLLLSGADGGPALEDAYRNAHPDSAHGTWSGLGPVLPLRLDWIVHSQHFRTVDARIDRTRYGRRPGSDHLPVIADLELPAAWRIAPGAGSSSSAAWCPAHGCSHGHALAAFDMPTPAGGSKGGILAP